MTLIELRVAEYLDQHLKVDRVPVYIERPAKAKPPFVIVEKTGESGLSYIHHATILLKIFSTSLFKTASLSHQVVSLMQDFDDQVNISSSDLNSETNWTDTERKEYYYQAVFLITYMEE